MEIRHSNLSQYATGIAEEDAFLLDFSAYLFKVIRGTAARFWHRKKHRMIHEMLTDFQSLGNCEAIQLEDVPTSAVQLDEITADKTLLTAIGSLTRRQREILVAYVFQEKTIQEIAKEKGVSSSAIYGLLSRAIQGMQIELNGGKNL